MWDVNPEGKSDEEIGAEGLNAMETWMREMGVVMNISEFGVKEEMLDDLVKSTLVMEGGYKVLTQEEIKKIFKESM